MVSEKFPGISSLWNLLGKWNGRPKGFPFTYNAMRYWVRKLFIPIWWIESPFRNWAGGETIICFALTVTK